MTGLKADSCVVNSEGEEDLLLCLEELLLLRVEDNLLSWVLSDRSCCTIISDGEEALLLCCEEHLLSWVDDLLLRCLFWVLCSSFAFLASSGISSDVAMAMNLFSVAFPLEL